MALSWNEIKHRALNFTKEWQDETRERAEKDSFWNDFFDVFGISRKRVATFEEPVKKLGNKTGFIDLFWKGLILIEQKSRGKSLDAAYTQATDYFYGIPEHELPKYILVSDFERFRLYDLEEKETHEFCISDFHKNIKLFGFIAGYQKKSFREEDPVNIKAAELMGKLHDKLKESGYTGHSLEIFLVRLLFCLFAEDTGIFEKNLFEEFVSIKAREDGSDLGALLAHLFQVLDKPAKDRLENLDEHLVAFPYINGKLFKEQLLIAAFDSDMRKMLLGCNALDWGQISPAIFGSMFQSVMNPEERRDLGAHYTSEKNILKVIKPLFLDELWEEFESIGNSKGKLEKFHEKIGNLKFLDPACGCGNFLIVSYRELRLLELEILKKLHKNDQRILDIGELLKVDVDQFYGIEYDEFPARIAEVALWLIDHQMNLLVSEAFGLYFARLPLNKSATIVHGNALRIDWEEIVPKNELNYILGNPPFAGSQLQSKDQRGEMKQLFGKIKGSGTLDYVAAWYLLAAKYIQNTAIKVGFVSTNSITQGEQTSILWNELLNNYEIKILFAHQTFQWSSEARGAAAVHCVIIGFANFDVKSKPLYCYEDIKGEPNTLKVSNINPYLVKSGNVLITSRSNPVCDVPEIQFGNMPNDGGNLLLTDQEREEILKIEPAAGKFIKPLLSAREYLNGRKRYCIWLQDASPSEVKGLKEIQKRIQAVKQHREKSTRETTRKLADFPTLFGEIRQPQDNYILVPRHSSERRKYIPIGFFTKDDIAHDSCLAIPDASLFHFGVLTSEMHMAWVKYICGRIKSDYRYSNKVVYNNYPWPKKTTEKKRQKVEEKAQAVLDIREEFPESSLADLYDPLSMPPKLLKAHQALDKAVDLCYRPQAFKTESARMEFLFSLYEEYLAPILKQK